MNHVVVDSTHLASVAHDPATNVMEVRFRGGKTYRFHGVTADVHEKLLSAKSKGRHFFQQINGKFKHEVVKP